MENTPQVVSDVMEDLASSGRAIVRGLDFEQFQATFDALATRTPHRDSDARQVTRITPRGGGTPAGYAGFGYSALTPHTDGSSLKRPPTLIAAYVEEPAAVGGTSTFVDGQQLVARLTPIDIKRMLSIPIPFGAPPGIARPLLEPLDGGFRLRYRDDGLAGLELLGQTTQRLRRAISYLTERVQFSGGDAYFLLNGRWLHGRTAFNGPRTVLRLIGEPRRTFHTITLRGSLSQSA